MHKYIIGYGWGGNIDVINIASLAAAEKEAANRSMQLGLLDDDLADTTWAEEYTDDRAYELGWLDEPTERDVWRSQAPWR